MEILELFYDEPLPEAARQSAMNYLGAIEANSKHSPNFRSGKGQEWRSAFEESFLSAAFSSIPAAVKEELSLQS